jgi:hypothetical protein
MKRFVVAPTHAIGQWFLESRRLDRMLRAMFLASLALTCIIAGASLVEFKTGVYRKLLKPSFDGLRAKTDQLTTDWKAEGWCKARSEKTGVDDYRVEDTFNGLTLYTTMGAYPNAELIDMNGKVVHRWQLSMAKACEDASAGSRKAADDRTHWHRVKLFPNGDLVANYNIAGETPYGGGLIRIDKNSNVVWRYMQYVHHDFDIDESGAVYALIHENTKEQIPAAPHLKTPMLKDYIVLLSSQGKELKRIGVLDSFAKSEKYRHYLDTIKSHPKGDHTHTNDVSLITEAFARHHDFCKAGDLLISLRESSMLAIVNIEREEVVWAARGIWEFQHDPDPLDNGNLLIFDNRGNNGPGGISRILEWNPRSGAIDWCYVGTALEPFESNSRGCQELLPNGNMLITESNRGRLFEITRNGETVWEFNNPHRLEENKTLTGVMYSAQRYSRDALTFLGPEQGISSVEREANSAAGTAELAAQ